MFSSTEQFFSILFVPTGCTGALAHELTKAHPEMRVTVFDLPTVVEMSGRFSPQHSENRVAFLAGKFGELLQKADLNPSRC